MNPRHLCQPGLKEVKSLCLHRTRLGQRGVTGRYEGSNRSAECGAGGGPAACPSDCWLLRKDWCGQMVLCNFVYFDWWATYVEIS